MPVSRNRKTQNFRSKARNRNLLHRRHDHIEFLKWFYARLPYSVMSGLIGVGVYDQLADKFNRSKKGMRDHYSITLFNWELGLYEKSRKLCEELIENGQQTKIGSKAKEVSQRQASHDATNRRNVAKVVSRLIYPTGV